MTYAEHRALFTPVKLGTLIRALRHGFCNTKFGFLRISGDGPFRIEVLPLEETQFQACPDPHRMWWSEESGLRDKIQEWIKPLAHIKRVKVAIQFYVDDNGERLCK